MAARTGRTELARKARVNMVYCVSMCKAVLQQELGRIARCNAHLLVMVQDGIARCVGAEGGGAQRLGPHACEHEARIGGLRGAWGTGA